MYGAAPDAELGMYRITCTGIFTNDVWIDAVFRAHDDGATIISSSAGNPGGWTTSMLSEAAQRLVDAGVVFIQGAGNDGLTGAFSLLDPAFARSVVAVGSANSLVEPRLVAEAVYAVDGGEETPFLFWDVEPMLNFTGEPMELYVLDSTVCGSLPEQLPDLSGKIVLSPFRQPVPEHLEALLSKGATQLLAYDLDEAQEPTFYSVQDPPEGVVALALIEPRVAEALMQASQSGKVMVTIFPSKNSRKRYLEAANDSPGAVSYFSSWGPSFDLALQPSLTGIGSWLLSTAPVKKISQGFSVNQGTSYSAPLIASVVALVTEARGGHVDPATMQNLLVSHSYPQLYHDGDAFSDLLAPVAQQGGGLVRAFDAAYATTLLRCDGAGLNFNDSQHSVSTLEFSVSNTGNQEVTYRVSQVAALTAYLFTENATLATIPMNLETVRAGASLSFSHGDESSAQISFAVASKDSQAVRVTAKAPDNLDSTRFAMWSGWVAVNGSDGSSLSLPYQGFSGSLRHHAVMQSDSAKLLYHGNVVTSETEFTLPAKNSVERPALSLAIEASLGAPLVHAHYVPVTPDNSSKEAIGQVSGFPVSYMPSSLTQMPDLVQFTHFEMNGMLDSGDYAPEGLYKIVVRALRNFGDADRADDWDMSETQQFGIKYVR
ncbi:hypothetical protein CDD82_2710 [Ophiocordyceps australis]|uniref:Peptidase S8/S53 domain-containing protein n=1 Tax=Ophiocordyceps australis TaxID=1399860 RepID=A0A2C5ZDB9_9HYPO|nr:hypothetical protein CDD82_2710 [Ophiocordyceps australis]